MIDFRPFYQQIATTNLSAWLETLPLQLKEWEKQTHGDYAKWSKIVDFLPDLQADTIDLKNAVKSDRTIPLSEGEKQRIIHHLKQLMPWRKGPYHLFDIHVDCEWRSDFKWDRVLPHLAPLKDRTILDVGCGSGYHMWRMVGEGAKMVVGIDKTRNDDMPSKPLVRGESPTASRPSTPPALKPPPSSGRRGVNCRGRLPIHT